MNVTLRVLHLASFKGNIGDNANHNGSRSLFEKMLNRRFAFSEVEIRDFYRRQRQFDSAFIDEINDHDLFIVGGGNYFELWPEGTKSGTSINFGIDDLEKITTPTLFYSLGVDTGQGVASGNKEKFKKFCDYIFSEERFFASVRNDGATANLAELYGEEFSRNFTLIPDGGFFCSYQNRRFELRTPDKLLLGLQVAGDMPDQRFKFGVNRVITDLVEFITRICGQFRNLDLVLFNHIPKDLSISTAITAALPDVISRERLFIAPYGQGPEMAERIFGIYSQCDLVIANRFHANVVPISMNIPCIGISNFKQINGLYDELELHHFLVDINSTDFTDLLTRKTLEALKNRDEIKLALSSLNSRILKQAEFAFSKLNHFLSKNSL